MKNSNFLKATAMVFTMIVLIGSAFAEKVVFDFGGNNGGGVWQEQADADWDNPRASVYAYLYMDVLDDEGNDAAYLSVSISRSYYGKWIWPENQNQIDAVEYSASACVYPGTWQGMANTWVQVPGKRDQQKHRVGPGHNNSAYASASSKRDSGGINTNGKREATASARAWLGGINAYVKIDISEF
ncbi:MAG: hypothetical protein OXU23_03440 [Candidatus Poribacteria bacterium]|nr:hypothetical protein [Candidatus Poribacteria bacterium]